MGFKALVGASVDGTFVENAGTIETPRVTTHPRKQKPLGERPSLDLENFRGSVWVIR